MWFTWELAGIGANANSVTYMERVPCDKQNIKRAADIMRRGGVVVFPTETSYGIGCDMRRQEAVWRIYKIKGREFNKPLPAIVCDQTMAEQYAVFSPRARQLAERYWPGPLTLVLPVAGESGLALPPRQETIALRVSSCSAARDLSCAMRAPLAATSANRSGDGPAYSADAVEEMFSGTSDAPDIMLDNGALPPTPPSTIVQIIGQEMRILRRGPVSIDAY